MAGSTPSVIRETREKLPSLKLGDLCDRFLSESAMILDNTDKDRKDGRTRLSIVRAILGDARDVTTLCENDVRQYEATRRRGGIHHGGAQPTAAVRQRAVQGDIKLLKQALRWACSVTRLDGSRLLTQNPLEYVRIAGERDVRRPVASFERFEATREEMRRYQQRYLEESRSLSSARDRARA